MDLLEQFKTILNKKYLSHIHTTYTDGSNSVEEYCQWAFENNYDAVVFSEHVRKEISYNFSSFINDIDNARRLFPSLTLWTGVESKVFPDGTVDMPEEILPEIQVIFFACHSFPKDVDLYKVSFKKVFQDRKWKKYVRIWAHPGRFFKQRGILETSHDILKELINSAITEGVLIENNVRYSLPPPEILTSLSPSHVVTGYDAHSVDYILNIKMKNESK